MGDKVEFESEKGVVDGKDSGAVLSLKVDSDAVRDYNEVGALFGEAGISKICIFRSFGFLNETYWITNFLVRLLLFVITMKSSSKKPCFTLTTTIKRRVTETWKTQ